MNESLFVETRPKPAYGRQGLEWDRQVRIQLRRVHFGVDIFKPTKNHEKQLNYVTHGAPLYGAKT